ncbi:MAG: CBS domain-containing protein [Aeropyrum sp.]|nr:CBS domain-containing protein [Aeropyrum sp.]MCE4616370.1 CBS domain-containing protein [Aeropyrum sp.]
MPVFKRYTRRPSLRASHVMSSPPIVVGEEASIIEAASIMRERGVGSLIVVDGRGRIVGVLTERDVINSLAVGKACSGGRVGEVMSRNIIVASRDESLESVVEKMREANVRHVPVIDEEGRPVGVISARDIIDLGVSAFRLFVEPG